MSDNMDNPSGSPTPSQEERRLARRRLVRGVASGIPVILTVKARSVMAGQTGGGFCLAPSATASIALLHSRPDRERSSCSGRTPGYWKEAYKTHQSIWQRANQATWPKEVKFGDIYSGGFPGKTMRQVMDLLGNQDTYQFGAHIAAAYYNFVMGWVPAVVLDLSDLQAMWAGRYGTYEPTPGVKWGAQQIVDYLKSTMTL